MSCDDLIIRATFMPCDDPIMRATYGPCDDLIIKATFVPLDDLITLDNKFQNIFCICDEYVINLFVCIYEVIKEK